MEAKHLPLRRTITLFFVLVLVLGLTGSGRAAPQQALSFIVQGQSSAAAAQLVEQYGGTVTSRLNLINGVGATLTAASRAALQSDPRITAISANAGVEKAGDVPPTDYPDVTAAVQTWEAGVNGTGVTVAVVDTGLGWHPALFKGIDGRAANRIVGWKDFVDNSATPKDPNGHGTHIAGIIANSQQGPDLEWNGMAPGVDLVGVRVLNEEGHGTYEQVIQGVQ
ncbi:MAG TPA: S8 family serine peptidase, partial [Anaerolineales bacterium]